jgi:hypothetical protein
MTRKLLLQKICPNACINDCRFIGCSQCNEKLNEWLDEYDKHVIEQYKADTNLKDTIREIHDNVAQEMYYKGIDEFLAKVKEKYPTAKNALYYLTRIAEELKAGGKNEN